jgi:hypothetical protein
MDTLDRIFRCDCGGSHFVSVRYWRDDDWPEGYLSIESEYALERRGLWARVKLAARLVWRGACTLDEVLLSDKTVAELRATLEQIAPAKA